MHLCIHWLLFCHVYNPPNISTFEAAEDVHAAGETHENETNSIGCVCDVARSMQRIRRVEGFRVRKGRLRNHDARDAEGIEPVS